MGETELTLNLRGIWKLNSKQEVEPENQKTEVL
jgi:hypothetical protein